VRQQSESLLTPQVASLHCLRSSGTLLCLASAAAFGAMAIFGKLAYADGATAGTLLAVRFTLAAAVFWAMVLVAGEWREVRALSRRDVAIATALGACGYAIQAGSYFAALERIDASLLALLLYTFPAIVAAAAVVLGRERMTRRRLTALVLSCGGGALVVVGAGIGRLDAAGALLGLSAAVTYSVYILVSDGVVHRVRPRVLSALVCSGAAVSLVAGSAVLGELRPGAVGAEGWAWLACLALLSTVAAVSLFFAGLRRAGPTTASILSTAEPLVTVVLAFLVFGEVLTLVQLAGGALVLSAVPVLNARRRRARPGWRAAPAPAQQTG
jgi:drug/metabolite transporter (DMT)-like permease